ncbi:Coiled-coil domain-containing protein 24 [Desmophyllum pertusum]|uniref:Coiled-coil domain-containing protein 24 n=1 Tax=Desmophyllum pertusum TaxID=174260 RepID=A0A9X0CTV3_9CNID|nr:Coiled-coil domain-containing protein 24 [Desmophyllum pertusum]
MSERSLSSMEWRLESFESRASLWRLIEEFVPESERLEIKEALGEDLVDETLDLQNETSTLLEIWQDYREETDKEEKEQALQRHLNRLPEPPMIRENLKKEVKMFVEMLHQRAREEGRNTAASVLSQEESNIVEYVFDNTAARPSSSSSRPSTAHSSRDGRQTPMRATPSSDGSRCTSSLSDHLDSMNDKLNALEIDRITDHLRQLLLEEKEGLLGDIAFLQDCLMEESDYREHVTSPSGPRNQSLRDLRDLGTKLEKELLHECYTVTK